MKKRHKILRYIFSMVMIMAVAFALCSCQSSSSWNLSETDVESIDNGIAYQSISTDGSLIFEITYTEPVISQVITVDDVKVLNKTLATEAIKADNYTDNVINGKVINECSVTVTNVECSEDLTDVKITFEGVSTELYAVLINKNVTTNGHFVLLEKYTETLISDDDSTVVYEKTYASEHFNWKNGLSFTMSMLSNIANISAGYVFKSPTTMVAGVMGILTSIGANFTNPEGANVVAMFNTLNDKIDNISANLTKNFNQLQNEEIQTQFKVDQAILLEYQEAINNFNQNYIYQLDNFYTYMNNSMSNYIREAVNSDQYSLDIWFYKDDNGVWQVASINDIDKKTMTELVININDFTNSKEYLDSHNQTIKDEFNKALEKDIKVACGNIDNNSISMSLEDLSNAAYTYFMECMMQKYFVENPLKATELQVLVENESMAIYGGGIGTKSIVEDYVERLKYMYNFAGESKTTITTIFANLLSQLDNTVTLAAMALGYCHYDDTALATKYKTAREYIQACYESLMAMPDSYCYFTQTRLNGQFYTYQYTGSYTNLGNYPTLTVRSDLQVFTWTTENFVTRYYTVQDSKGISAHDWVDSSTLKKMVLRYNLLRQIGVVDSEMNFISYLNKYGAMTNAAIGAYNSLTVTSDKNLYYRIFTGITNERNLNTSDCSYYVKCTAKGTPKGDHFSVNSYYWYAGYDNSDNWNGHVQESEFFDAASGTNLNNKLLALWASYNESRWYWRNDEHYFFNGLDSLNNTMTYFFGIEKFNS